MVDVKSVEAQLKRIKFNWNSWGRAEAKELPHILTPDEKIYECVNGIYDGGFALLVSTDMRVLLIDKKPLNYLTVEDLRFDMINELDYSHRLLGARITISAGNKTLKFTSYNQSRLRKLIGHVQDRMSEIKKEATEHQENQKQHLAQINQQLQAYLLAQHQQLMQMQQGQQVASGSVQPIKPSPELSDYLFAQSLLQQFGGQKPDSDSATQTPVVEAEVEVKETPKSEPVPSVQASPDDLLAEGYKEIFGKTNRAATTVDEPESPLANYLELPEQPSGIKADLAELAAKSLEINPLKIASAKLPMMLRNRKFGRPSFHAHSQSTTAAPAQPQAITQS